MAPGKKHRTGKRGTTRAITNIKRVEIGSPPEGPINAAAVDSAIERWVSIPNKRRWERYPNSSTALVLDAREMAQGREDLPRFERMRTPISARNFDWLELLLERHDALGNRIAAAEGQPDEPVVRTIRLVDARTQLEATRRLLFDCLRHIAPWGREVTAGDPARAGRYALQRILARSPSASPGDPGDDPDKGRGEG